VPATSQQLVAAVIRHVPGRWQQPYRAVSAWPDFVSSLRFFLSVLATSREILGYFC